MMIFDEIIQLMIGLNNDQLKKVRDFILMKSNLYDPIKEITYETYFCPVCKSKHIIKFGKNMENKGSNAKIVVKFSPIPQIP